MTGNERSRIVIQPRDVRLLRELSVMRIIDREQAQVVAGFRSTTRANARLLALHRTGLLRRFFQGTAAGGKKALYALSPKGARLVDVSHQGFRHANDELLSTNFFVTHQLWVNRIYCSVKFRPIPASGATFVRWVGFSEAIASSLIPDGYFEISVAPVALASFIEVDLGHEGLSVWKAKVQNYLRYAASGDFERHFGQSRFRVLVVANTRRRAQAIRNIVRHSTDKIFWLSSFEAIDQDGFWASVWLRPTEDETRTFF
jgi:hypothetical protein